ncbi:LiaF transmembrane domain-containing protein [Flaviaesturariibacter amylovorans]|uniref:DUF5668 domain-containing protein n=1 Tax=Flaviaesturariibacter amylovorans TaxID=1084520 RepID=A0ABP8HTJ2_9BACT
MKHTEFHERAAARWADRRHRHHDRRGRVWTGLFLLTAGSLLLAHRAGVGLPPWLFSWPVLLIGIGLWVGARHSFKGFGWLLPVAIGAIGLADDLRADLNLRPYIWPLVLIGAGLIFIFRPKRPAYTGPDESDALPAGGGTTDTPEAPGMERSDVLDITAILGGVKKNVLSKQFRGGEVTAFMGGAEINLAQADFQGRIRLECTNVMGGTKLIIPPDWDVQSEIVAIFGGVDDKRPPAPVPAPNKVLFLEGTCVFGGVEIRSYY